MSRTSGRVMSSSLITFLMIMQRHRLFCFGHHLDVALGVLLGLQVLGPGDDLLLEAAVVHFQQVCPAPGPGDGTRLTLEAAVRHALMDARVDVDVDLLPDLELLDGAAYGRESPLPERLCELVPGLFSFTV